MMRIIRDFTFALLVVFSFTCFTSCGEEKEEVFDIELPPAPLITNSTNWAVINSSYLRLRDRPEDSAPAVATLWRGSVLEVLSKTPFKSLVEGEEDYWYQVNHDGLQGWVFGAYLEVYDAKDKAEKGARAIREK